METNLDAHPDCVDLLKDTPFEPPSKQTSSSSRLLRVPNFVSQAVTDAAIAELTSALHRGFERADTNNPGWASGTLREPLSQASSAQQDSGDSTGKEPTPSEQYNMDAAEYDSRAAGHVSILDHIEIPPDDDYFDSPVESDLGDSDQPSSDDVHMIEVLPEDKADLAWQPSPEWQERHSAHQLPTREDDEAITARALIEVVPESEKWEVKCPQIAEAKRYLAKLYTSQDPMTQFLIKAVLDMSMQTRLQVVRQIPVPDGPLGHLLKGKGKAIEQHNLRRLGSRK